MFNKILIANRGAIATRILRTLKQLNVTSVAVYHRADRDSLHVQQADEAWCLGEGRVSDTYLNQDKILDIAQQAQVDAIHPGYGFLSENPDFVRRCEQAGITFIGPTAEQMLSFGLKHTARELAKQAGVPLLPGSDLIHSLEQALLAANDIGYPVILKSTAGGGGIGMQVCHNAETLQQHFDSVRRLGANNFSNDGVFIEKYVERARHIEVQIFGDGCGDAVAMGERDCSTQRRNQKVIEETPAPNIPDSVREQLQSTAIDLVKSVQYRSAGTVEYIYDQSADTFYFLEVNTRLQVEHGVTEEVFDLDLVAWMIQLAAGDLTELVQPIAQNKHAIQVRLYAEDPNKNFQPSVGLLSEVTFPQSDHLRIDHWVEAGLEVSALFDPMLAKLIAVTETRETAIKLLDQALVDTSLYGLEHNIHYLREIIASQPFQQGDMYTQFLADFATQPITIDVLQAGTMTTIQDFPGRAGYWDVGVPPSGPFDAYSFCLANRLLENDAAASGLEITLNGPTLRFNANTQIVITGAQIEADVDGSTVELWQVLDICAGQTLTIGKVNKAGARAYLCVKGGIDCPEYLGSKSTFTLGQFGGHTGRALKMGDVLHFSPLDKKAQAVSLNSSLLPEIDNHWQLRVIYGPHGADDFFTHNDIDNFLSANWEVHYHSSRTGVRLIGPKPEWARSDGGEAGMHPSNIHDNAYAIGTVDFTGDMPVILGPDGPSLGGFVCPFTVIQADLWKLGQLKAGDTLQFIPVAIEQAVILQSRQQQALENLQPFDNAIDRYLPKTTVIKTLSELSNGIDVVYRPAGDRYLLVEYGELVLDIELRFRVHALWLWLQQQEIKGILELTPGIRSLQIHYEPRLISLARLLSLLEQAEQALQDNQNPTLPSRIVHLPLSWNDAACQQAIDKYVQSVRKDAPWCPSNIEFIRRINGLDDIAQVKDIVFSANYLVMGLGDVYLGAPVATPIDPRHRLVTTKYNPARTWTAENSVGIGGSYLCVYGMEGPGGYQFVGRTLQMWNRYHQTQAFSKPWLLRFFDQIRFYEVEADELLQIREDFPKGRYDLKIETSHFNLQEYQQFLNENKADIDLFTTRRQKAFDQELQRWVDSGQMNFELEQGLGSETSEEQNIPKDCIVIESPVAGSLWKVSVKEGDRVEKDQTVAIIESMKMEFYITATQDGIIHSICQQQGNQVSGGQGLIWLQLSED